MGLPDVVNSEDAMKIVCNHFGDEAFSRMAESLKRSVALHCPDAEFVEIVTDQPDEKPGMLRHYTDNHAKLLEWRDAVYAGSDGERLVLMDADTLVLGDLAFAFDETFDIGWTWRPGRLPVNSGVVYVRVNDRSRAFMDAWVERDSKLMEHRALAAHGRSKYGGANQAAFMWLITHGGGQDIALCHPLMCKHWNSVDQTWCDFNEETRVLHIKGRLRDACMGVGQSSFFKALKTLSVDGVESQITIDRLAEIWRKYDATEVMA